MEAGGRSLLFWRDGFRAGFGGLAMPQFGGSLGQGRDRSRREVSFISLLGAKNSLLKSSTPVKQNRSA